MTAFHSRLTSLLTLVAYLLALMGSYGLHTHGSHCHEQGGHQVCGINDGHATTTAPKKCCDRDHSSTSARAEEPADSQGEVPRVPHSEDDCAVCQFLALTPTTAAPVSVPSASDFLSPLTVELDSLTSLDRVTQPPARGPPPGVLV